MAKSLPTLLALFVLAAGGGYAAGRFGAGGATLTMLSEPDGASVYVDQVFRGRAERGCLVIAGLGEGEHTVRVEAEGYGRAYRRASLPATSPVEVRLEPLSGGTLTVKSDPAGAAVLVDGHGRGRTPVVLHDLSPGNRTVELALTNHLSVTRAVRIAPGESAALDLVLPHRQVETYRARLRANPKDANAYNDLCELLFVLGRYKEAADACVEGFYQIGWLRNDARRKHQPDARFHRALHERILAAIREKKPPHGLLREFKEISRGRFRDEYGEALAFLVKTYPDDPAIRIDRMEYLQIENRPGDVLEAANAWLALNPRDAESFLHVADILKKSLASEQWKARRLAALQRVFAAAEKHIPPGHSHRAAFLFDRHKAAEESGDAEAALRYLDEAVRAQTELAAKENHPHRKNQALQTLARWRIELARTHIRGGRNDDARRVLDAILNDKTTPGGHRTTAQRMLDALP